MKASVFLFYTLSNRNYLRNSVHLLRQRPERPFEAGNTFVQMWSFISV